MAHKDSLATVLPFAHEAPPAPRGGWEEWMRIGNPDIDEDHQQILAACDLLADALALRDRPTARSLIESLMARVSQHLAREERILRDENCPLADQHAVHHDCARLTVRQLYDDFLDGKQSAETVLFELKHLFVSRLIPEDLACKPYLVQQPARPGAAALDPEIASMVEYLVAAHGTGAGVIADAVCASAEAAGNGAQAKLWRQIRAEIARP